jgi:2,4-dienoyl-CoA reductase-like NADH-dependent reductase (Old Yellow Enzyme family)/thioredoxin reductase/putative sterol carrier protein
MPGMDTNFGDEEGNLPDKLIDYYELRAKGGVGLIIVEGAYFDKRGAGTSTMLSIDSNKRIGRFKELVGAIKKHGAHALIQIYHAGAQATSFMIGMQAVAPSAVPFEMTGEKPVPLTKKQISEIVKGYGKACSRAKKAGFDGVEIHAGHGYLLNQFFSLRTNKRIDEYGGQSFENRTRIAVEIIKEVRKTCGEYFIIGFRLNGSDYIPEGLEIEDAIQIAKILEKEGIDLINISGGVFDSPRFPVVPYMNYPKACFVSNAKLVKDALEYTPVAVVGRINTPDIAEQILQDNKADLTTIGRALIADPEFPNKIKEGREDEIRVCIGCNTCLNQIMTEQQVLCAINPNLTGSDEDLKQTDNKLKILVVGSGPAGLEFSRVASLRRHEVIIVEKGSSIGGSLNHACKAPMKKEVKNLIDYYNHIINKFRIEVNLNTSFSEEILDKYKPDILVLATGITPALLNINGINGSKISYYSDVFEGRIPKGNNIVVIGGDTISIEIAEFLSHENKKIILVSENKRLGSGIHSLVAREILPIIEEDKNIEIMLETKVEEIIENKISFEHNGKKMSVEFDDIISTLTKPSTEAEEIAKGRIENIFKIGDCKGTQTRNILDSIQEGYNLGLLIETPEAFLSFGDEVEMKIGDLKSNIKNKIKKGSLTNEDIPKYLDIFVEICNKDEKIQKKNKKTKLLFQISIENDKDYFIKIEKGFFSTGEGKIEDPNVIIMMDSTVASGILSGKINAASAYLAKDLKFEGSMMLGMKFRSMVSAVAKVLEEI